MLTDLEYDGRVTDDPRLDRDLVRAARDGDADAFEILYRRYRDWVAELAFRFTRDRDLAGDVCAETFLYLLRALPRLELRVQMKTFLYPVVRNVSITLQSRSRRTPGQEVVEGRAAPDPAEGHAGDESRRALAAAVDALAPGQREVLLLRFVDDLSLAEIAEAMEIPVGTVKSRLHGALRALREDERARSYFEEA